MLTESKEGLSLLIFLFLAWLPKIVELHTSFDSGFFESFVARNTQHTSVELASSRPTSNFETRVSYKYNEESWSGR